MEDELRPEYNLKDLRVRKVGSKRKINLAKTIQLDPDVAEIFPDDNSVNEALRFLIRMTRQNRESIAKTILSKNISE
ncbi:MAG: hypothetical protein RLZZ381_2806 [Cyanobacteriota bacterium]